jgi:hypothetical protein
MDVQFGDSFTKSLKRLMWHESKVYKFYALFRYDIPHFLKNIWRFHPYGQPQASVRMNESDERR